LLFREESANSKISQREYDASALKGERVMKFDDLNVAILIIYTTIDLGDALMEHEKMSSNILEAEIFVG
jgi:hypothetical protein